MQRYFSQEKRNNQLLINENDFYHIKTVMRMKENDLIEVVYDNKCYLCYLKNIDNMLMAVIKEEIDSSSTNYQTTLIVPLLKENKMDLILQKATELGVQEIIVAPFDRCLIKLDDKTTVNKLNRWQRIIKEASEQAKRVSIPTIALEKSLFNKAMPNSLKLICDPLEKNLTLKNVLKNKDDYDKIVLVFGPEGGFSEEELHLFKEAGFIGVSLGKYIMRTETVPIYLLSVINYEYM